MTSSLAEAFREAIAHNPDADQATISSAMIHYLESAVAKAILNVKLPPVQSPASVVLQRLQLQRYRSSRRRTFEDRQKLIAELRSLQHSLNGHAYADRVGSAVKWNGTVNPDVAWPRNAALSPSLETFHYQTPEVLWNTLHSYVPTPPRPGPYSQSIRWPTALVRFTYDDQFFQDLSDPFIERISGALEDSLRQFTNGTPFTWNLEMSTESDIELPAWKRFVLRVHVSAGNFDEKLKIWDELDAAIRKKLAELAEESPTDAQRIAEFDKLLYLRMDMA